MLKRVTEVRLFDVQSVHNKERRLKRVAEVRLFDVQSVHNKARRLKRVAAVRLFDVQSAHGRGETAQVGSRNQSVCPFVWSREWERSAWLPVCEIFHPNQ